MNIPAGNSFRIELEQIEGLGSPWMVRVYKKFLFLKKRISSDWFLDGEQAKRFAEQLASELVSNGSTTALVLRRPGWILHRPPH